MYECYLTEHCRIRSRQVVSLTNSNMEVQELKKNGQGLSRNFTMLVLNAGISRGGTAAFSVMILWMALALTHSPVITGVADGMAALPLFASFLVGAFVDRSGRKKVLGAAACLARPAIVGLMFIAVNLHSIILIAALFFLASFLLGFTSDVMNSVRSVWSKQFLDDATYKKGTSTLQAASALAETAGYGIAGAFLVFGYDSALFALSMIFVLAFAAVLPIKAERERKNDGNSIVTSVREGLHFIRGSKFIMEVMLVSLLANFLFGTMGVGLTALIQRDFHLPASYFGALLFTLSIAVIIGSVLASKISGSVGRITTATLLVSGVFLVFVGISRSVYYDFAFMAGIGILVGLINVAASTLMLRKVPQELMARVQGTMNTFGLGAIFFAGTIGGVIIALTSVRSMIYLVGAAVALLGVVSLTFGELNRSRF